MTILTDTVKNTSSQVLTAASIDTDITGMSITLVAPAAMRVLTVLSVEATPASVNWEHIYFVAYAGASTQTWRARMNNASPQSQPFYWGHTFHAVFEVAAGSTTFKWRVQNAGSDLNITLNDKRMSVLAVPT